MFTSEMKSHIEGIKNRYAQTVVTGWAFVLRSPHGSGEAEAAVLCNGRPVQGLTVAWTERPDLISAFFASSVRDAVADARFGFRICFPSEEGKTYRLRFTEKDMQEKTSVREYVIRDGQIMPSGPAGVVARMKCGIKRMLGRTDGEQIQKGVCGQGTQQKMAGTAEVKPDDPLISIIVPVYRPDPVHYMEMIESVMVQHYGKFQLCLADGSDMPPEEEGLYARLLQQISGGDERVVYRQLERNFGISGNTNQALAMAEGTWIAMLDHDDLLEPDALWEAVRVLRKMPAAGFLYTDSDLTDHDSMQSYNPLYKPDWSPETMYSANYITHFSMIRKDMMEVAGGFDPEMDGAQDWDMFWKVAEQAEQIVHIPKVLYHWRVAQTSTARSIETKPYALDAQLRAINGHIRRMGYDGSVLFADRARYLIRVKWNTPVWWSVVGENGLAARTGRPDESRSGGKRGWNAVSANGCEEEEDKKAKVYIVLWDGEKTEISEDVCRELAQWAVQPGIGLVFPKLLSEEGSVLSAGVMTENGEPVVLYQGCPNHVADLRGNTDWYRNVQVQAPVLFAVAEQTIQAYGTWMQNGEAEPSKVMAAYAARLTQAGLRHLMNPFAEVVCRKTDVPGSALRTGRAYLVSLERMSGNRNASEQGADCVHGNKEC